MRFLLLLCTFFSLATSAQTDDRYTLKYVWAESGLSLRAEGRSGAEKLTVIPFGGEVTPTGKTGELTEVTALKSVTYNGYDDVYTSAPYVMNDHYVEVIYNGQTGFVFAGYLSEYNPLAGQPDGVNFEAWLEALGGKPREVQMGERPEGMTRGYQVLQYDKGITLYREEFEGGGSTTLLLPWGSLNDGFLIGSYFFGVTDPVNEQERFGKDVDYLPEILNIQEDGTLIFGGDMSSTTIRVMGRMLIIRSEGGC